MRPILIILIFLFSVNLFSQNCNCLESFNWMVTTFEKNDAGFQYVVDKKGKPDYIKHVNSYREKAKAANKLGDCHQLLNEWLKYFRSGHIGVNLKEVSAEGKKLTDGEIRSKFQNEKKISITEKELVAALQSKKNKDRIEGIWNNGTYRIGIIEDEKIPGKFTGFVLKADSVYWMPGQVKAEFTSKEKNKIYAVDYLMKDHSPQNYAGSFPDTNTAIFSMNGDYWKREYPKVRITFKERLLLNFAHSGKPFIETITDKTTYLRIPSFAFDKKKGIDSILNANDKLIRSTPNLIIDIRYGTGGSDNSYQGILPYLYTNPRRSVGMQFLATEMNAKAYEEYAKQGDDTSDVNYCLRVAKAMRAKPGQFIDIDSEKVYIDSSLSVLPFPQKVAIICNKRNGSTDEQFLLDAKQSRKVKVYGHSTGGMLDISNMNFVDFPDKRFSLGYCMSKSYRIPNFCIDGIGIQPDIFIDDTITEEDWIFFVAREIEK